MKLPSDCSRSFDSLLLHHEQIFCIHAALAWFERFNFAPFFGSRISQWLDLQYKISSWIVWDFVWFMIINILDVLWSTMMQRDMSYISSRGIYILINVISGTFRWTFRTQWRENINARWQSSLRENKSNDCSTKASGIHGAWEKTRNFTDRKILNYSNWKWYGDVIIIRL